MADKLAYRVTEAMDVIGLGRTKIYELIDRGELESYSEGRRRLIPRSALEDYVERRRAEERRSA